MINNTALVIDTELDGYTLIEIGLTKINLKTREIIKTYSIPIKPNFQTFEVSEYIEKLTGWSTHKLRKQGVERDEALRRLVNYGADTHLLVSDCSDEFDLIEDTLVHDLSKHRLNVSVLFQLVNWRKDIAGIVNMLKFYNMEFEGLQHRADVDSFNIARLFLQILNQTSCNLTKSMLLCKKDIRNSLEIGLQEKKKEFEILNEMEQRL